MSRKIAFPILPTKFFLALLGLETTEFMDHAVHGCPPAITCGEGQGEQSGGSAMYPTTTVLLPLHDLIDRMSSHEKPRHCDVEHQGVFCLSGPSVDVCDRRNSRGEGRRER